MINDVENISTDSNYNTNNNLIEIRKKSDDIHISEGADDDDDIEDVFIVETGRAPSAQRVNLNDVKDLNRMLKESMLSGLLA